jgi:hypothetical protein
MNPIHYGDYKMSIEKDFAAIALNTGRIADALEHIAGIANLLQTQATGGVATTKEETPAAAVKKSASTTVKKPAVEEPAVEEPAVEEPAVEEPAVEEPAVEEPAVEEPELDPLDATSETEEVTFTEEEVRKALKTYRDIESSAAAMLVLKKFGADGMGSLKKSDYAAVMALVR